jgi:cell division protein FtsB
MPEHATVTRPRPRTAPIGPRRVSGPSRRPVPAGPAIRQRGGTSAFEKLSRIPDHRVVDRLLRGRACILIIGLMLGGIVAMQVSLLRMNAGISRAVQTQATLAAKNMALEKEIAQAQSGDGVGTAAAGLGMIDPPAGQRRFLTSRGLDKDARLAAKHYKAPSERSILVMKYGGILPGALAAPGTAAAALAAQLNGQPAPTPTPVPGAVPTATPPTATNSTAPAPTVTPVVPAPTATVAPPATAPQG